jgi:hypothetical protein
VTEDSVPRKLANWLTSYVEYGAVSEAPRVFHFWAGVSAVAGALRRKVWFDQIKFQWYPSFYIIFVAHPGIATKSVTADGSMDLLRSIPGIKFGPDEVTWQQLVTSFAAANETFELNGEHHPMSPITILSSEFGMMMDFRDAKMVNLFITLWDGRKTFEKQTKMSGSDMVEAPWINLLACTTPQWINSNMDANTIGGGFTSRCIFVYGEGKEHNVAYIKNAIRRSGMTTESYAALKADLVHDLEHISVNLCGEYVLTPGAEAWGEAWYNNLWDNVYKADQEEYIKNYTARKQAHLHKLAMVMAAAQRDELVITLEDLEGANAILAKTEETFKHVFSRTGQSDEVKAAQDILRFIVAKQEVLYEQVYRMAQIHFPNARDFEGIIASFIRGGQIQLVANAEGKHVLRATPGQE